MYVVYVVDLDYGARHPVPGLGNCYRPVAWFTERLRALDYAKYLAATGVGEFSKVIYHPEDYVAGSGYVGEVVQ